MPYSPNEFDNLVRLLQSKNPDNIAVALQLLEKYEWPENEQTKKIAGAIFGAYMNCKDKPIEHSIEKLVFIDQRPIKLYAILNEGHALFDYFEYLGLLDSSNPPTAHEILSEALQYESEEVRNERLADLPPQIPFDPEMAIFYGIAKLISSDELRFPTFKESEIHRELLNRVCGEIAMDNRDLPGYARRVIDRFVSWGIADFEIAWAGVEIALEETEDQIAGNPKVVKAIHAAFGVGDKKERLEVFGKLLLHNEDCLVGLELVDKFGLLEGNIARDVADLLSGAQAWQMLTNQEAIDWIEDKIFSGEWEVEIKNGSRQPLRTLTRAFKRLGVLPPQPHNPKTYIDQFKALETEHILKGDYREDREPIGQEKLEQLAICLYACNELLEKGNPKIEAFFACPKQIEYLLWPTAESFIYQTDLIDFGDRLYEYGIAKNGFSAYQLSKIAERHPSASSSMRYLQKALELNPMVVAWRAQFCEMALRVGKVDAALAMLKNISDQVDGKIPAVGNQRMSIQAFKRSCLGINRIKKVYPERIDSFYQKALQIEKLNPSIKAVLERQTDI